MPDLGYTRGLKLAFLGAITGLAMALGAEADFPVADDPHLVLLDRYIANAADQSARKRGLSMSMKFLGKLTKLKKNGELTAIRQVDSGGRVSFDVQSISGDDSVKKYVLAKYLSAEEEVSGKDLDNTINNTNYKFKFKRVEEVDGRPAHVYEVNPRKKRVGLVKGEIWIDEQTAVTLREEGQFVKSPSIFLKKISFLRKFILFEGVSLPSHLFIRTETRLAGPAEMDITYTNFARLGASAPAKAVEEAVPAAVPPPAAQPVVPPAAVPPVVPPVVPGAAQAR
jgi:hypothetical protein